MSEPELILEVDVDVKNGLPGTSWSIKRDPRYLFAVVYKLREYALRDDMYHSQTLLSTNKFVARFADGDVQMEIPYVDGNHRMFLSVLIQVIEAIAKVLLELDWGSKFMVKMNQQKIAVPKTGGPLIL